MRFYYPCRIFFWLIPIFVYRFMIVSVYYVELKKKKKKKEEEEEVEED